MSQYRGTSGVENSISTKQQTFWEKCVHVTFILFDNVSKSPLKFNNDASNLKEKLFFGE